MNEDKKTIVLLVILAILVVIAGGVLIYKVKIQRKLNQQLK